MGKKIVLIVEDEPELRELVAERLSELGYQVYQAANGEEGLALVAKVTPDVIVSDVLMPKKDGNRFLKELRQSEPGKNIPFIVLTARVAMRDYFEVEGVDAFLTKPFKIENLVESIEAAIQKRTGFLFREKTGFKEIHPVEKETIRPKDEIIVTQEMAKERAGTDSASVESSVAGISSEHKKKSVTRPKIYEKKKILILEDDMEAYRELQRLLEAWGATLQSVLTPQECIEEANRVDPDVIILKDIFKKVDAEDLANKLKTIPRFQRTPVIIYTKIGEEVVAVNPAGEKTRTFVLNQEGKELLNKVREIL